MTPADRIRRAAMAVADQLGGNHLRYMAIVAVVLYADESVNNTDEWGFILDADAKAAAIEGADEIRERVKPAQRKRAA